MLDEDGKEISPDSVAVRATAANISIRTGCFCNPEAAEFAFNYEPEKARSCFESIPHDKFTLQDFSVCMDGKPAAAVRASLGIASNDRDIDRLIVMLGGFKDIRRSEVSSSKRITPMAKLDSA